MKPLSRIQSESTLDAVEHRNSAAGLVAAALLLAAVTAPALAQGPQGTAAWLRGQQAQALKPSRRQPGSSDRDKGFMQKVAADAMMQVELSKVAVERAQSPEVRQFALESVENLAKAAGALHAMAQAMGVQLPQQLSAQAEKLKQALAAEKGTLVDSEYMAHIVPASTVTVNLFKDQAENGSIPKLKQFAEEMQPKLERRQRTAKQLAENLGARPATHQAGQPQQPTRKLASGSLSNPSPKKP